MLLTIGMGETVQAAQRQSPYLVALPPEVTAWIYQIWILAVLQIMEIRYVNKAKEIALNRFTSKCDIDPTI